MMLKKEIIRIVKEVLEKDKNVLLAYLFGSIANGMPQPISDVDVAILLKNNSLERQANIAKALHIPEDKVDIVDLSQADLYMKYNVLKNGIKLVDKGFEEKLINELVERYPEAKENLNLMVK